MFSLFKTTSYKTAAVLAVASTSVWKIISFLNSVLVALYFGAQADTDVYFYLIMIMGFGVTFMQRLNNTILIPEAMFLAEEDPAQSRRFLTMGFYFYLLVGLALCVLGLMFPIQIVSVFSRFDLALLKNEHIMLCAAFFLFATNLLTYYLTAVAEMHKFFTVALLGPLNALCPLLGLLFFGKYVGIILAIFSMCVAPLIAMAPSGLFNYLQMVNGFYNVPIFTLIIFGMLNKTAPAWAAKVTLIFFMVGYGLTQLGIIKTDIHFLHILAILFAVSVVFMYITGKFWPAQNEYDDGKDLNVVDTTPWNMRVVVSIAIVLCVFGVYVLFSKFGIAA